MHIHCISSESILSGQAQGQYSRIIGWGSPPPARKLPADILFSSIPQGIPFNTKVKYNVLPPCPAQFVSPVFYFYSSDH